MLFMSQGSLQTYLTPCPPLASWARLQISSTHHFLAFAEAIDEVSNVPDFLMSRAGERGPVGQPVSMLFPLLIPLPRMPPSPPPSVPLVWIPLISSQHSWDATSSGEPSPVSQTDFPTQTEVLTSDLSTCSVPITGEYLLPYHPQGPYSSYTPLSTRHRSWTGDTFKIKEQRQNAWGRGQCGPPNSPLEPQSNSMIHSAGCVLDTF